jgi:ubiquinone/menaquinone biosynthesis C-methylase UbiE
MSSLDVERTEAYVEKGYRRWSTQIIPFDYKERKGERIADIIRNTGGLPPLAVEIGVGPGAVAKAVSQAGPHVIGMDLSAEGLVKAQKHCAAAHVDLLRASGFSLPFVDGSIPLIYASQVLHIFDHAGRLQFMEEARRVLQPGGRFVFDMKNIATHPLRYLKTDAARRVRNFPSSRDIEGLLRRAGFSRVVIRAGLFPVIGAAAPTDLGPLNLMAHTRFYVAWV